MAEVLLKNQICGKCGAEVRLNAFFCYNCGSQVVSDEVIAAEETSEEVSNAWFKETITETKIEPKKEKKIVDKSGVELTPLAIDQPIAKPSIDFKADPIEKTPENKETKPLKTAASIKEKPKSFTRKKVEVTWEEPRSAPNVWFLIVSLIFLLFAAGLVAAMLYIR